MDLTLTQLTGYYNTAARVILPIAAILLLCCCARLLLRRQSVRLYAVLRMEDGSRLPVLAHESTIGRNRLCDIQIPLLTVSRRHAVLTLDKQGWRVSNIRSKGGVFVNGERVDKRAPVQMGDIIQLADVPLRLSRPLEEDRQAAGLTKQAAHTPSAIPALFFLTLFQVVSFTSLLLHYAADMPLALPLCFGGLLALEWIYFAVRRLQRIGVEILAFFLAGVGLLVAGSSLPSSLYKQFAALVLGVALFCVLRFVLQDIALTMKLRYIVGALAVGLLALNLLFGESRGGAKNWINLGFITIQPSEFVKIAYVFAGCATLERLMTARNTILFFLFSCACIGPLFIMRDFGTAAIFFVALLLILYMRSGNWLAIVFLSVAAVAGSVLIIFFKPYIAARFATYLHAWEFADAGGYQQTRTMIAIGSGGLLGVGGGCGNLDRVAAADTDLVFGFVSEEWGLLVALCCAGCLILFALHAVRGARTAPSAYYAIAACAAAGLFLFQAALNIFGSTDLLPLTGVTFPLVSNGGTSMMASFAMLAFIHSVDQKEAIAT